MKYLRTTEEEVERFKEHKKKWERGEIRLIDYVEQWKELDGERVPIWYPPPLGFKVKIDKQIFFDKIGYRPSDPQCRFHANATAKVLLFVGGARAGKSRAGAMEMVPVLLTPGTRQWIVSPEYDQAIKEFEYILDAIQHRNIWPMVSPFVKRIANHPGKGDMEIILEWYTGYESILKVKTEKVQRSLLSEELDQVLMVEASQLKQSTWTKYIRARLITRDGRAIIPTSPNGLGWVAELERMGDRKEKGVYTVHADTRYNPTVDVEVVEFWGKEMSDQEWAEQILGIATPKSGLVYPEFKKEIHVDTWDDSWPKSSWPRYRLLDFGFTNPFVCLWAAVDEDGRVYIYREIYRTGLLTDEAVELIARAERRPVVEDKSRGIKVLGHPTAETEMVNGSIGDWDAQQCAEFRARGIKIRKAKKNVEMGILAVKRFLKPREDGKPRLFISPKCSKTIEEFALYSWQEGKEIPKKENDHAMDALRYGIYTQFQKTDPVKALRIIQVKENLTLENTWDLTKRFPFS